MHAHSRFTRLFVVGGAVAASGCASAPPKQVALERTPTDADGSRPSLPEAAGTAGHPGSTTSDFQIDPRLQQEMDSGTLRILMPGDPNCVGVRTSTGEGVCVHRVVHAYWQGRRGAICLGRPLFPTLSTECSCGALELIQYFEHMAESGRAPAAVFAVETNDEQRRHRELGGHDHMGSQPLRSCYCAPPSRLDAGGMCIPE